MAATTEAAMVTTAAAREGTNRGIAACFSPENYDRLQAIMFIKHCRKGTFLFREGDPADKLYFVMDGLVKVTNLSDNGRPLTLFLHQKGDLIGQIDPFPNSSFAYSAEVTEDGIVGMIRGKDLETLMLRHSDLAVEYARWIGMTQRLTQAKLRDYMLFGKTGALCSLLIRLSNCCGVAQGPHTFIDLKLNHAEMAEMIGATRESVNRMLNGLRKDGIIDVRSGRIVIKNMSYLRDVCRCEHCPAEICRL